VNRPQPLSRSELATANLQWLLVLRLRGKAYRVATDAANVANSDTAAGPSVLQFLPGLEKPVVEQSVAWGDVGGEGREQPISMVFPTAAGWGAIADADQDLCDATAELSLWREGDDFAARWVMISGYLQGATYSTPDKPVSFTITQNPWEDRSILPPTGAQATATTWPRTNSTTYLLPTESVDRWYPYVFGCPGAPLPTDTFGTLYGWPVFVVEVDDAVDGDGKQIGSNWEDSGFGLKPVVVLIAGHPIVATTVTLYNVTRETSATVAVTRAADLIGRIVSIATVDGIVTDPANGLDISLGDELVCSFPDTSAGGMADDDGTTMRGAGRLARWFLRQATIEVDQSDIVTALSILDGFRFDFYFDEPKSAWEHLSDEVLSLLPASTTQTRTGGLSLVVWPWTAKEGDAQWTLDPDSRGGAWDESGVECSPSSEVVTDIRVEFAADAQTGTNMRHLVLSPRTEGEAVGNPYLFSAWSRLQRAGQPEVRRVKIIEAGGIQDPSTAYLLATVEARRYSSTRRTLTGDFPQENLAIRPGTPGIAVASDFGFSRRLCWVSSVAMALSGVTLAVETLPDFIRTQGGA
jgi:hypothetical protein